MDLTEFIEAARLGKLDVPASERDSNGKIIDTKKTLSIGNLEDLVAEAFNLGVFSAELPWDSAMERVKSALGRSQ